MQLRKRSGRVLIAAVGVAVAALTVTGCSASSSSGRDVNIYSGNPGSLTNDFNPFVSSVYYGTNGGILGAVYEPLFYYNTAVNEPPKPWLGTSYTVSPDGKTYDVTLRSGVKWQDGKPFSASDVAYTYNLIKDHPDTNLLGLQIASATAPDATHVKIVLTEPNFPNEMALLGETFIVPEHIWKSIKDPSKAMNVKPVGTGAFTFGAFTPQSFTLVKNPDYYIKGQPAVPGLRFVTETGNTGGLNALNAGQVDWAGIALEDVTHSFLDKNPKYNKDVVIPGDIKTLVLNLTKAPFNDLAFRQALSLSIDRGAIISQAFGGTDSPANPTGMLQPRDKAYIPAQYEGKTLPQDIAKAKDILKSAGYSWDSSEHLLGKDGKPVTFNVSTVTGYTDTITADQLLVQDFAKIGIQATPQQLSLGAYTTNRSTGQFDVLDDRLSTGPTPFQSFDEALDSTLTAPVGKDAASNYARFDDPTVQALLTKLKSTDDKATVTSAYQEIGTYMAENQPYILLSQNGQVTTYRDQYFTGWPTTENLWGNPAAWIGQNIGWVAKRLTPRS